jgi:hypothetical protein
MVVSKYVNGLMHQLITAGFTVVTLTVDPRWGMYIISEYFRDAPILSLQELGEPRVNFSYPSTNS